MKRLFATLSLLIPSALLSTKFLMWRLHALSRDPETCDHRWYVIAGIWNTVELQVQCIHCLTYSEVPDPSVEEWEACAGAMENPYPWEDKSRIRYYETESPNT